MSNMNIHFTYEEAQGARKILDLLLSQLSQTRQTMIADNGGALVKSGLDPKSLAQGVKTSGEHVIQFRSSVDSLIMGYQPDPPVVAPTPTTDEQGATDAEVGAELAKEARKKKTAKKKAAKKVAKKLAKVVPITSKKTAKKKLAKKDTGGGIDDIE